MEADILSLIVRRPVMADAYLNLAAYKFLDWDALTKRRDQIEASGLDFGVRGTVLLAPEGINLFVSARPEAAEAWLRVLCADPLLTDLNVKRSQSAQCEFGKWRVRVKKEIITLRQPQIRPQDRRAESVRPTDLARWLESGQDDQGRPVKLLDARNRFEVEAGSFESAAIALQPKRLKSISKILQVQKTESKFGTKTKRLQLN